MIDKLIDVFKKYGSESYKENYYDFWSEDIGITIYSKKYDKLNKNYPQIDIIPYYNYEIYLYKGYNKIRVVDKDSEYNCIEDMKINEIGRIVVYREKRLCLYDSNTGK